jgi:hypothetical protein
MSDGIYRRIGLPVWDETVLQLDLKNFFSSYSVVGTQFGTWKASCRSNLFTGWLLL